MSAADVVGRLSTLGPTVDASVDGFYTAFVTGKGGNGFAMFLIRRGIITGADFLGTIYDGIITSHESGMYKVTITSRLPPNITNIQGQTTGPEGDVVDLSFSLPSNFLSEPFIRINSTNGPANARFVKIRGLNE
jgi:hypothetical protein